MDEREEYKAIGHMEVHLLITGDDKRGDEIYFTVLLKVATTF